MSHFFALKFRFRRHNESSFVSRCSSVNHAGDIYYFVSQITVPETRQCVVPPAVRTRSDEAEQKQETLQALWQPGSSNTLGLGNNVNWKQFQTHWIIAYNGFSQNSLKSSLIFSIILNLISCKLMPEILNNYMLPLNLLSRTALQ